MRTATRGSAVETTISPSLAPHKGAQVARETQAIREGILAFQEQLSLVPGAFFGDSEHCPLRHSFAPGIYVREISIPAGMLLVGKIHKHSHPNFLMAGEVIVYTESTGSQHLVAPRVMISPPGTKRVLYTLADTWWVTVHHNRNDITDLEALEAEIIAKSYEEFEAYIAQQEAICPSP